MLASISIVLLGVGITVYELFTLQEEPSKKELVLFFSFLLAGMTLSILQAIHVPIPNPVDGIILLFQPAIQLIDHLLGTSR